MSMTNDFLPTTREEMTLRGWDHCDLILVTGDAYVDHPSFGAAIISRTLEAAGYRVGIIAQPRWDVPDDFRRLGRPLLAFLITAGNMDSMVSHYTASGSPRSDDRYSPGGVSGSRPDRATITYTTRARQAYHQVPVIIGGVEASLRRLSHYDVWSDKVRRSILLDAKADLLIYGMAERSILEAVAKLRSLLPDREESDTPEPVYAERPSSKDLSGIRGTVTVWSSREWQEHAGDQAEPGLPCGDGTAPVILLPTFEQVAERDPRSNTPTDPGKVAYATSIRERILHENPMRPEFLAEKYDDVWVIQAPPQPPETMDEMDRIYDLPFTREWHPSYDAAGGIPALQEVRFSVTSSRGCFGGCSFCALTFHQGRSVRVRSKGSIVHEIRELTSLDGFTGSIHDIGGPTANFRAPACKGQERNGPCPDRQCLFPEPCPALQDSHDDYLSVLEAASALPGVNHVYIRSGIRYDYLLSPAAASSRDRFIRRVSSHHVSGQLKVAPEHVSPAVLDAMGKAGIDDYTTFSRLYAKASAEAGKEQYIIPYFISGHPGSRLEDAIMLAEFMRDTHFIPEQTQDFYPTPGTVSTCMYYTGLDPRPGRDLTAVHIPKGREKRLQRALLQYHRPQNHQLVREALRLAGRSDLIGNGPRCLVPPDRSTHEQPAAAGRRAGKANSGSDGGKRPGKGRKR